MYPGNATDSANHMHIRVVITRAAIFSLYPQCSMSLILSPAASCDFVGVAIISIHSALKLPYLSSLFPRDDVPGLRCGGTTGVVNIRVSLGFQQFLAAAGTAA